jgi:hypothetical protein
VDGYAVPAGTTSYAYEDVYFADSLGTVSVGGDSRIDLPHGATARVSASLTAAAPAPAGRQLFGEVRLLDARGSVAGKGSVIVTSTAP